MSIPAFPRHDWPWSAQWPERGAAKSDPLVHTASWFDPIGRPVATADYGTNGGAVVDRPDTVTLRSDTVLVSSTRYAA